MTNKLRKAVVVLVLFATFSAVAGPAFAQTLLHRIARVQAFCTDSWQVWVGSSFRVVVNGDGDTDLDLYVYDAGTGRLLGRDDDYTDYCIVSGYSDTGRIIVRIVNRGGVYNEYELRVR